MNAKVMYRDFSANSPAADALRLATDQAYSRGLADAAAAAEVELDLLRDKLSHQLNTAIARLDGQLAAMREAQSADLADMVRAVLAAIGPGLSLAALRAGITEEFVRALAEGHESPARLLVAACDLDQIASFVAETGLELDLIADDELSPFSAELVFGEASCRLDPGECIRRCQAILTRHLNPSSREPDHEPERAEQRPARLHAAE